MTRLRSTLTWVLPAVPPLLLAFYPLLSLFQQNQSEIALSVLRNALLVAAAIALALYALFLLATRRPGKAGVLASLVVVVVFYFGTFRSDLSRLHWDPSAGVVLAIWLALFAVVLALVLWLKSDLAAVALGIGVFGLILVVGPTVKIARYRHDNPPVAVSDPRLWPSKLASLHAPNGQARDIYVIIPDDYERPDLLKRYFRYDDSAFVNALRKRGFIVAPGSRSPYSKSEFNMASALNLDYLSRLPGVVGKDSQDVLLVREMIHDNRAASLLKPLGYRYEHIDSDNITFGGDNPHISPLAAPDNLTYLWGRDSILRFVGGRLGFEESSTNERFRDSVRSAFSKLRAESKKPGPKLVLFHTLMPHDPYVFGARGQAVTFPDRSDTGHSTKLGMRYYVNQLRYLNGELLRTVDAIKAGSRVKPIIVLQSDEGFEALEEDWGESTVRQMRVKGLTAFYLPGKREPQVPKDLNTVNSLRLVFNRYFGTRYPLLKSVSYPELDNPYDFQPMKVR